MIGAVEGDKARPADGQRGALPPVWDLFGPVVLFSILANVLLLTGPLFMLQVYDRVLASGSVETLLALLLLTGFLFALYGVFDYCRIRLMARIGARLELRLHDRCPVAATGMLRSTLPAAAVLFRFLSSPAAVVVLDLPLIPVFLLVTFALHPLLGWTTFGGGAILMIAAAASRIASRRNLTRSEGAARRAAAMTELLLNTARDMPGHLPPPALAEHLWSLRTEALRASLASGDRTGAFASASRAFRLLLQSAILAVGALLAIRGQISGGQMIAGSILLGRFLAPLEGTLANWAALERAAGAWAEIVRLLSLADDHSGRLAAEAPGHSGTRAERPVIAWAERGHVQGRRGHDHSVADGGENWDGGVGHRRMDNGETDDLAREIPVEVEIALSSLRLTSPTTGQVLLTVPELVVQPGSVTAICGANGSGKSLLLAAIAGQIPVAGRVSLGGMAPRAWGTDLLRLVGTLPQAELVQAGTLGDVVAARLGGSKRRVILAALEDAGALALLARLPDGLNTNLATRPLGSGDARRIALARALCGHPPVLLMDEAEAHWDSAGFDHMIRLLDVLRARKATVLLTTHSPAVLRHCDSAFLIRDGRLNPLNLTPLLETGQAGATASTDPRGGPAGADNGTVSIGKTGITSISWGGGLR